MSVVFEPDYRQQCRSYSAKFEHDRRTGATRPRAGGAATITGLVAFYSLIISKSKSRE